MPTFSKAQLEEIGTRIFVAAGVQENISRQVTQSLVASNLIGVDSHGFVRIPQYLQAIKSGMIVPDAEPEIVRDNGVAVLLDGHDAFGQIVARRATEVAIERAKISAVCAMSFAGAMHIGRLGEYVGMAADEGLIAFMIVSGSRPGGLVAPFGSRQRILGTNPIAFAIPAGTYPPLVADFSTGAVAEGKVRVAMFKGLSLQPGWVVDREGKPTTTPSDLYDGGAILPFGEHKGYSLSLLAEVLGGVVSGAEFSSHPNYKQLQNGAFLLVVDQTFFRSAQEYNAAVDTLFTIVKGALPADGNKEIMLPGEPEQRTREKREREGIPIDDITWGELQQAAEQFHIEL